jgi:hypothetical protein
VKFAFAAFSNAYSTVVRVDMVAIPEAPSFPIRVRASQVFEAFRDQLDGCGCVGYKDQVEMFWIGTKETQRSLPCIVDYLP